MSEYYHPHRTHNLYRPDQPFRLSRSKVDLFLECPRCFYLDRKLGIARPPGYPFSLNSAVDTLLKKEFDLHRAAGTVHPLAKAYGLDLVPLADQRLDEWRDSLRRGITYALPGTNIVVTGGVDDVWTNPKTNELVVVDYKATSKDGEVTLDADWQVAYKRQLEIYQWLFRRNGFVVSKTGYFVYCNGRTSGPTFDAKLEFDIKLLPYQGDDSWVEATVRSAAACLAPAIQPQPAADCDYCRYFQARSDAPA